LSGVRWRVGTRERGLAEGGATVALRTAYLVVSHDDRDVDELASGGGGVGRELVMCGGVRCRSCRYSTGASVGFRRNRRCRMRTQVRKRDIV
jgi:hypothetical protein